jgi:hypothetical protein
MVKAGFHCIAKSRALIFKAAIEYRGVYSADCHKDMAVLVTGQEAEFESGMPHA